ncbi:hypothetical protein [Demequina phytophila]|uniref:hypothetical protein n=1 Tax=Demequina phytophila TaxID=1638981 RepID=UPI0007812412|nr:hypothetical protein [Demequina phytophila]
MTEPEHGEPVEPGDGPAGADSSTGISRPRRRRGLAIALAVTLAALVGLAVAVGLLATARGNWEAQNADLRDRVDTLVDEVSDQNARLSELEGAKEQLAQLKEEYSSAVNQGAQGTELVEELEDIVDAYQHCVDAQSEHFDVLRNIDRYVASSVDESEQSIRDFCSEVAAAYVSFQAKHG